ncbi:hypothetical protein HYDPIDRAFT_169928 [Hydnomerulius pinastri MD-312]|uniref:Uncharacterized protein n=1 Tax=Hydnomerulius pinastri MD-312 TaxID=994086 RepID=A0A0C9WBA9_9AGAM|nr:hypothetical protein HYDPIDRAFT_169928 [Hydnomerulius pinastri MD-312]
MAKTTRSKSARVADDLDTDAPRVLRNRKVFAIPNRFGPACGVSPFKVGPPRGVKKSAADGLKANPKDTDSHPMNVDGPDSAADSEAQPITKAPTRKVKPRLATQPPEGWEAAYYSPKPLWPPSRPGSVRSRGSSTASSPTVKDPTCKRAALQTTPPPTHGGFTDPFGDVGDMEQEGGEVQQGDMHQDGKRDDTERPDEELQEEDEVSAATRGLHCQ